MVTATLGYPPRSRKPAFAGPFKCRPTCEFERTVIGTIRPLCCLSGDRPRGEAWITISRQRKQSRRHAGSLRNRLSERRELDLLIDAVQAGESRVVVVCGEPGVGKTALLDYLSDTAAADCRVERAAGVQSEMELAFSGLHQLLGAMLDRLAGLPGPQRDALRTAFGIRAGPAPDPFLVGLAALGLLTETAGERPLICLVDDMQWVDRTSARVLGFVARRLAAEPVGLVFAARAADGDLAGLPTLVVTGLREEHARALLDSALAGSLDAGVRDVIVAETRGNPLALLELPRGLSLTELAGGFGLPGAVPLTGRIEESFRRRLETLPVQTRRLLRLAAADPTGNASLVWRAAGQLGIPAQAAAPAAEAELVEFGVRVRFRHPLVRSAAYRSASAQDRREAHGALAEATDPAADPDRRAWHRAAAAAGPDEEVAAELERSAGRAGARGGMAAAAAFLERAVSLTDDPTLRAGRTLAAAEASVRAGAFGEALDLLAIAEPGPLNELQSARLDLLRGEVAFASGLGSDAPTLLLKAAGQLELLDLDLARGVYLDAWRAALFAGHLAGAGDLAEVSRAARALAVPERPPRLADLLLDGLTLLVIEGPSAAAPALRQAASTLAEADTPAEDLLRWGWLATTANEILWDYDGWRMTTRLVQLARDTGALDQLPFLLNVMAMDAASSGDFATAASLVAEADTVCEATGSRIAPYAALMLASLRGSEAEASALIRATLEETAAGGHGSGTTWAHWTAAVLFNGLGRSQEAMAVAREATEHGHVFVSVWALPELIEAAVHTGSKRTAEGALDSLAETTQAGGTEDGLGIEARSRALLSEGRSAEEHYREAIGRLGRSRRRPELARAHLLYGEWLRREGRRAEAREELHTASGMLDEIGMEAFAERARHELLASGEAVAKRTVRTVYGGTGGTGGTREALTAQEAQAARLAVDGLSNPEIAARLFISTRTVQYHLGKVFAKLGISSRTELHRVLPGNRESDHR